MSEPNYTPQAHAGGTEDPVMSTPETLSGIFFEPGRTFDALRARPRFLVAALICVIAITGSYILYITRIGYDNVIDAEISVARKKDSNANEEQLQKGAEIQKMPVVKAIRMGIIAVILPIIIAVVAGLYLLGANLMGGQMSYKKALTLWAYGNMPPIIITVALNVVLLFVSPPDSDAEIVRGENGLVHANPGVFVDATAHPALSALLSSFDLITFYGLFLTALGLRKLGKLKSGSAWTVVLALWGLGLLIRLFMALVFGRA
jgi:hypothetical protein